MTAEILHFIYIIIFCISRQHSNFFFHYLSEKIGLGILCKSPAGHDSKKKKKTNTKKKSKKIKLLTDAVVNYTLRVKIISRSSVSYELQLHYEKKPKQSFNVSQTRP